MPETTGEVRCVRVGDDFGFTTIAVPPNDAREIFILCGSGVSTPADPPIHVRIVQSDWVAMLRQALANDHPVTITHAVNSGIAVNIQLGT
jgi:hypothetical protein